jgi:hypothetical protein
MGRTFRGGDYVYWSNPESDLADTPGRVRDVLAGDRYVVQLNAGGAVVAHRSELRAVDPDLVRC